MNNVNFSKGSSFRVPIPQGSNPVRNGEAENKLESASGKSSKEIFSRLEQFSKLSKEDKDKLINDINTVLTAETKTKYAWLHADLVKSLEKAPLIYKDLYFYIMSPSSREFWSTRIHDTLFNILTLTKPHSARVDPARPFSSYDAELSPSDRMAIISFEYFLEIDKPLSFRTERFIASAIKGFGNLNEESQDLLINILDHLGSNRGKQTTLWSYHLKDLFNLYKLIMTDQTKKYWETAIRERLFNMLFTTRSEKIEDLFLTRKDCVVVVTKELEDPAHRDRMISDPFVLGSVVKNFDEIDNQQDRDTWFTILNTLARPPYNNGFLFNIFCSEYFLPSLHFLQSLFDLPVDSYPIIYDNQFTKILEMGDHDLDLNYVKLLFKSAQSPAHRKKLMDSEKFLKRVLESFPILEPEYQMQIIGFLNDTLSPRYANFWEDLETDYAFNLNLIYAKLSTSLEDTSSLRRKLFPIVLQTGYVRIDSSNILAHLPELLENPSVKGFGLLVDLIKQKPNDLQPEVRSKVLDQGLLLFSQGKMGEKRLYDFLDLFRKQDKLDSLKLWKHIPVELRSKFLERMITPISLDGSNLSSMVCNLLAKEFMEMSGKEFEAELSPEQQNNFFLLIHKWKKLDQIPVKLFDSFTRYVKATQHKDQTLFNAWEALALQVPSLSPFKVLSLLTSWPNDVTKNYLQSGSPLAAKVSTYLQQSHINDTRIVESYFYACIQEYDSLEKKDLETFFNLITRYKKYNEVSGTIIVGLLQHLTKNPISSGDYKDKKIQQEVTQRLVKLFERVNNEQGISIPPELILEALEHQCKSFVKSNIPCAALIKSIFKNCFNKQKLKELQDYFVQTPNLESPRSLSIMAVYFCSVAHGEEGSKGQVDKGIKSILTKVNMTKLPETVFVEEISRGVLSSIVEAEPEVFLQTFDENQLEAFYREKERGLTINWHHLNIPSASSAIVVPPLPEGRVEYDELIEMFDKINFDRKDGPGYFDPTALKDDGVSITKAQARSGIQDFVDKVKRGPSYAPDNPIEKAKYIDILQRWVKNSIVLLRQKPEHLRPGLLLKFATAGRHCGGQIYPVAQDIYMQLSESTVSYETETLQGYIATELAKVRKGIFESIFNKMAGTHPQSSHIYQHAMKYAGSAFKVEGWEAYPHDDPLIPNILSYEPDAPLCTDEKLAQFLELCRQAYNPTTIINRLVGNLNGFPEAPATVGGNSAFRYYALEAWFNANMPEKTESEFIKNRNNPDLIQTKDKKAMAEAERIKYEDRKFKEGVEREYQWYKSDSEINGRHQSNFQLQTFFDEYEDEHPECTPQEVVEACVAKFDVGTKFTINRNQLKIDILAKHAGFKGDIEKEVDKVRIKEFDLQYKKALLFSDEYNGFVLSKIYVENTRTLKREWIIYMLERLFSKEKQNVLGKAGGAKENRSSLRDVVDGIKSYVPSTRYSSETTQTSSEDNCMTSAGINESPCMTTVNNINQRPQ